MSEIEQSRQILVNARRRSAHWVLAGTLAIVAGCGGGSSGGGNTNPPGSTITSVTAICSPASIQTNQTSTCTVSVLGTGSYSPGVTWTATGGTITSAGVFTPSATGTATVTATSTEDSTKFGSTGITVTSLSASISTVTGVSSAQVGVKYTYSATAKNAAGSSVSVSWYSSNSNVMTIDPTTGVATGLGTGTTTITATNSADTSKTATATVTVRDWILDEDSSGGINLLDATGVNQPVPLLPAFTCQVPAFFADRQSFACSNGGEILIYATDGTAKGTVQKYAINTGLYSVTDVSASPDGTHVVYHAVVLGSGTSSYDNVYTNTLDGQNQQLLSSDLTSTVGPTTPWWSPDGTTILWVRIESGAPYVWTMKATDGSNKARLFNTPSAASIWSADGTKIFYDHFADEEIWSRSANGSDSSEKLLAGGKVGQPYPSADNERFAYWANGSIVIANASTGGIITTLPINSDVLSW